MGPDQPERAIGVDQPGKEIRTKTLMQTSASDANGNRGCGHGTDDTWVITNPWTEVT